MSFDKQVSETCKACYFHIRAFSHIRTSLCLSRVRYKIGLLVYKCLHGLAPRYLSDFCVPVQVSTTRSSLRSAQSQECLLTVSRTKTKTIGPRGFFHSSPTVWNSLLDDLRDPELSIGCFRNKLKTFLFSTPYANAN